MKNTLLLLLSFSLCFAQANNTTAIDSLRTAVENLEAGQSAIKSSVDSLSGKFLSDNYISVKAAKETQELHNTAFGKMQSSFNTFTNYVLGIITLFSIFIGGFTIFLSIYNSNQVKELKNELKEEFEKKILESEKRLEKKIDEQKTNPSTPFEGFNTAKEAQ
jgi:HAMP domain-containing protein